MEKLAKTILKKDKNIIINEILKYDDTVKLLYLVVNLMTNETLDDKYSFLYLKTILTNTELDLFDFENSLKIIGIIDRKKHKVSYKFMSLKYNVDLFQNKMENLVATIKSSDGNIGKKYKNIKIEDISDTMKDIDMVTKSFDERKFITSLKMTPFIVNSDNINENDWIETNSTEILNRLVCMVKYFGISYLEYCSVDIINVNDFYDFSFDDKIRYYIKTTKKLVGKINEINGDLVVWSSMIEIYNKMVKSKFEVVNNDLNSNYDSDEFSEQEIENIENEIDFISSIDEYDLDEDSPEESNEASDITIDDIVTTFMEDK